MEKKKKGDLSKEQLVVGDLDQDIDMIRREGTKIHVLGDIYKKIITIYVHYLYHGIYDAEKNELVKEDCFKSDNGGALSVSKLFSYVGVGLPFLAHQLFGAPARKRTKTKQYWDEVEKFEKENIKELEDKVKHIKIYQDSKDSVAKDLGVTLKYVDTGTPTAFINPGWFEKGEDVLTRMKFKAYQLGADALVGYANQEGTPVKIIKKNGKKR